MLVLIGQVAEEGARKGGEAGGEQSWGRNLVLPVKESNDFGRHIERLLPYPQPPDSAGHSCCLV